MPRFETERVGYWENSALDGRIYHIEPRYSTATRDLIPAGESGQADEGDSRADEGDSQADEGESDADASG